MAIQIDRGNSGRVFFLAASHFDAGECRQCCAGTPTCNALCAKCHAIDKVSPSPLKIAPPFRTLHERYPVENLQEALAEGIVVGHPSMPQFRFEPDQVNDFLAFLKSLE